VSPVGQASACLFLTFEDVGLVGDGVERWGGWGVGVGLVVGLGVRSVGLVGLVGQLGRLVRWLYRLGFVALLQKSSADRLKPVLLFL
jgi:hypothetical protein